MEQREQYYATVRKPLRSPIHEMGTLERIPGEQCLFILIILFIYFYINYKYIKHWIIYNDVMMPRSEYFDCL